MTSRLMPKGGYMIEGKPRKVTSKKWFAARKKRNRAARLARRVNRNR